MIWSVKQEHRRSTRTTKLNYIYAIQKEKTNQYYYIIILTRSLYKLDT